MGFPGSRVKGSGLRVSDVAPYTNDKVTSICLPHLLQSIQGLSWRLHVRVLCPRVHVGSYIVYTWAPRNYPEPCGNPLARTLSV